MNYGMDQVLIGWGGMARAANPAQALRVATERSAFANLLDSDVHFAKFSGGPGATDADADADPAGGPGSKLAVAARAGHGPVDVPAHGLVDIASSSVRPAVVVADAVGGMPLPAAVGAMALRPMTGSASSTTGVTSRALMDPAQCQWSRSAFAACLRDGELNVYVRDDGWRGERDAMSALKQALRDMGISLGEIKINGVQADA